MAATEAQIAALNKGRENRHAGMQMAKDLRVATGRPLAGSKRADGTVVLSRSEELERGIITVKDLSDDELAHHKCYNSAGTFTGQRYPHTARVLAAMDAELLERGASMTRAAYTNAIKRLVSIVDHPEARVALTAIDRVMERVAGKVPDKLLSADVSPFMEAHGEIAAELARAMGYEVSKPAGDSVATASATPYDIVEGEVVSGNQAEVERQDSGGLRGSSSTKPKPARRGTSRSKAGGKRNVPDSGRGASGNREHRKGVPSDSIDVSKYVRRKK